jgi:hypothetical protein
MNGGYKKETSQLVLLINLMFWADSRWNYMLLYAIPTAMWSMFLQFNVLLKSSFDIKHSYNET